MSCSAPRVRSKRKVAGEQNAHVGTSTDSPTTTGTDCRTRLRTSALRHPATALREHERVRPSRCLPRDAHPGSRPCLVASRPLSPGRCALASVDSFDIHGAVPTRRVRHSARTLRRRRPGGWSVPRSRLCSRCAAIARRKLIDFVMNWTARPRSTAEQSSVTRADVSSHYGAPIEATLMRRIAKAKEVTQPWSYRRPKL